MASELRQIDLFRPFMARNVADHVAKVVTPDEQGRIYCGEGPKVAEFEKWFADLVGSRDNQPLALNSCTSALELALHLASTHTRGFDVITTPMTCTATNGAIVRAGGRIVWADVDPVTGLIDPDDVQRKVTRSTLAIVAVDWAGRSCDYERLCGLKPGAWGFLDPIPVIQDAAHNLFPNLSPGKHGDYVCWSFQAIKHLTTGDGGALLVPPEQRDRARLLRWYGLDRESSADFRCAQDITEVGFKMHMNDIAASIGLANIPYAAGNVAQQRQNAAWYAKALRNVPNVILPPEDEKSSWWLYTVLVDDPQGFIKFLGEQGIGASPVHRRNDEHTAFYLNAYDGRRSEPLPGVDAFASREVAIPVGWWLSGTDRERVAAAVWEYALAVVQSTELAGAA